jgi:hypothetical protein
MIQGREHLGFTLKTREPIGIAREHIRQDFQCNIAVKAAVGRAVHFSHPAHSQEGDDFVNTKPGAGRQCH